MQIPILLSIFVACSIFIVPVLMIYRPPKKINSFYGYRTKRSMSSNELWQYANSFWAKLVLRLSILTLFFQIALLVFFWIYSFHIGDGYNLGVIFVPIHIDYRKKTEGV